ncbi:uncharacterized protein TNCV_2350381 [Trichonephila clavipes]|uniref:Uncharacterized protein n=1 Tax=Trichonephila clavipes TaxID=2585209 RepID=A0A8X6SS36_TRICX|nr:uncharacterized protein TNCV_2350381 [Trichonephila clavipes]
MKCHICCILLLFVLSVKAAAEKDIKKRQKTEARQMEYISLINTLLQQTNVLSSVDGAMLAATTLLASLVTKMKPLLIASALSYILFVATAILLPGPLNRLGLPTMTLPEAETRGRSVDGGSSSSKLFDSVMADTLVRSIQITPVKNIMTNVSVNVITDAMARVRILSRMLVQQLSLVQRNMVWFSRSLSNECAAEIVDGVYGANTVTAYYVQFWFRPFRSGIFEVKDAPRTGRSIVENVYEITEKIEVDWHVSISITQERKIDPKSVLYHLHKVAFKKKLDAWMPQLFNTKKHDGSNFHWQSLGQME